MTTWNEFLLKRGITPKAPTGKKEEKKETFSLSIELDQSQQMAVDLAKAGKSFCLIGKAGTGKTTSEREIVKVILSVLSDKDTHVFRVQGTRETFEGPACAVTAFTRIASANSRRAITKEPELEEKFYHNITTIHNLLEFQPEFFYDPEKDKDSMRFIPKRNAGNPLTVRTIIFEEASMIDLTLWEKIYDAMLRGTQCIFVGDINQLPPVFGPSILNYALVQLPVVELSTVYRQESDSSVLKNAHNILDGKPIEWDNDFRLIEGGTKQYGQGAFSHLLANTIQKWYETGEYDPETDIFLTPFNKQALGSDSINNHIAQIIGTEEVWEIIAGIRKLYLSVGDKVLYNKQIGIVTKIARNGLYAGKPTKPPSKDLTRFGCYKANGENNLEKDEDGLVHMPEFNLEEMAKEDLEELSRQASHIVDILLSDTGQTVVISKVGDFSKQSLSLAYALTVHKSQGCEWKRVFILLHKDHSIMAYNELLYTAVTRASEKVTVISKKFMVEKAIATRRIKGNGIKEKIEFFNANMTLTGITCTK